MGTDDRPKSAQELADRIQTLIQEPEELFRAAMTELIAEYGSREAIPLEARAVNETMAEGYNRAAEALVEVAELAFNYAADQIGPTGAQADWAAMQLLGKLKGIDGPYMLVRASNYLYPQHDGDVTAWLNRAETKGALGQLAVEQLAKGRSMSEAVRQRIAALATDPESVTVVP